LRRQFAAVDLIEIQYFASLVRVCHTETASNVLRVQISARQILLPPGSKKVSAFMIVLLFEIEDAGSGLIVEIQLLVLFLRIIV
jgi:hypothetical protein